MKIELVQMFLVVGHFLCFLYAPRKTRWFKFEIQISLQSHIYDFIGELGV